MSTFERAVTIAALAFVVIGVFLPWGCSGDFVTICERGINIGYGIYVDNQDGWLVLIPAILTSFLVLWGKKPARSFAIIATIFAALSLVAAIIPTAGWIKRVAAEQGMVGAATLQPGLIFCVVGAAGLLLICAKGLVQFFRLYKLHRSS